MLRDNSDRTFEKMGKKIPYYVINAPQYRQKTLGKEDRKVFFQSGEKHVENILSVINSRFGGLSQKNSVLDFGCGVGRVTIPFARRFEKVVGVDIAPSMLEEAQKNCYSQNVHNVDFVISDDNLSRINNSFDLVHSYIVLQHIPLRRGIKLFERLVEVVKPGGVGVLHINFARKTSLLRKTVNLFRKNFTPFHYLVNILQSQPWDEPFLQMNNYNLNQIMDVLFSHDIRNVVVEITQHGSHLGAILFFKNSPNQSRF